jgi:hypothetical protein
MVALLVGLAIFASFASPLLRSTGNRGFTEGLGYLDLTNKAGRTTLKNDLRGIGIPVKAQERTAQGTQVCMSQVAVIQ